jgi:SAM-dependent methyltransferase
MIFDSAIPFENLPTSDTKLKQYLNFNPPHNEYTKKQVKNGVKGRSATETDRGGWRGYDRVYSKYFKDIRNKNLEILEIGIMSGYGLLAWQRYFVESSIYGIDISLDKVLLEKQIIKDKFPKFSKIKCKILDSTNNNDWYEFYGKQFDIIIDDGDHHPTTQTKTIQCAWKYLKSGGFYFIEDVGHRYGEDKLKILSDTLESMKSEFDMIEIYSHMNYGLEQVLKNKDYLKRNNILDVAHPNICKKEYIVAIKKVGTKNG